MKIILTSHINPLYKHINAAYASSVYLNNKKMI
jgi:hypothetical protein